MKDFIWHNPRCSKSRQTLALIEEANHPVQVVLYLENAPGPEDLRAACAGLNCAPEDITRSKEALFKELGLSLNDERSADEWLAVLAENPRLIERPIVRINGRYAMGRPPENVLKLLD